MQNNTKSSFPKLTIPPLASQGQVSEPATAQSVRNADHEMVLDMLVREFQEMDDRYAKGEMQAFGGNSEAIFTELEKIRSKQLELASEHVRLERLPQDDFLEFTLASTLEEVPMYQRDKAHLEKKTLYLKDLMVKLEGLGENMASFHDMTNSVTCTSFSEISSGIGGWGTKSFNHRTSLTNSVIPPPPPPPPPLSAGTLTEGIASVSMGGGVGNIERGGVERSKGEGGSGFKFP